MKPWLGPGNNQTMRMMGRETQDKTHGRVCQLGRLARLGPGGPRWGGVHGTTSHEKCLLWKEVERKGVPNGEA